jgi:hypothetical protein
MKVEAYRCDKCGKICPESEIIGIYPIEDMFDRMKNYPICNQAHKTNVHHCMECYHNSVIVHADRIDRKKDMQAYNLKVSELYLNLKQTCVLNVMNKKKLANPG